MCHNIYVCGFSGFQQIQGMKRLLETFTNDCDVFIRELGKNFEGGRSAEKFTEIWKKIEFEEDTRARECDQAQPKCLEKCDKQKSVTHTKAPYKDDRKNGGLTPHTTNALSLHIISTFPQNVCLEHAEMTWSRFGITVSLFAEATPERELFREYHTLVSGFQSAQSPVSDFKLHLVDCLIRTSNDADILMQRNCQFELLAEESCSTEQLCITCDSGETRDSNSIGSVSGLSSEFVASYDGISVAKLSVESRQLTSTESQGRKLILTCLDSGLSVASVSCGLEHSLFLTKHGSVFSCGSSSRGQLGHGSLEDEESPRIVSALEGVRCVCVAAGGWHSVVVSESGDLYAWGWNVHGQLGLPSPSLWDTPCDASMQQPKYLSKEVEAVSLHLWPQCVDIGDGTLPEDLVVTKIACGSRHTAILTESGKVFTTGWNKYRQLGLTHIHSVDYFTQVNFSGKNTKAVQVWCGAWNSLFVVIEDAASE